MVYFCANFFPLHSVFHNKCDMDLQYAVFIIVDIGIDDYDKYMYLKLNRMGG